MNDFTQRTKIDAASDYVRRMMVLHDSRDLILMRAEISARYKHNQTPAQRVRFFEYYYGA